jgi:Spy/CpxP family protein refolding chaperone
MMSPVRRSVVVVASATVMTLLLTRSFSLRAQETVTGKSQAIKGKQAKQVESPASFASPSENSSKASSPGKNAPPDVTHRVPAYFSRLGLTEQQRETIYKIEGKYYPQIQAMEKQEEELRTKMKSECEGVLTPAQKQRLEQQRKAASEARKAASSAKAAAKTATTK